MSEQDETDDRAQQVYANTRHGNLSLDQIGTLMPGLGTLMPIISDRFGWMVHAGRGGNWKLARYQLRKVRKLFKIGKTTRPKWVEVIDRYLTDTFDPIGAAIEAQDLERFEAAVAVAVDQANQIHGEFGYGYIVYKVPERGPDHMETGEVAED